jgi:hypothetical protein
MQPDALWPWRRLADIAQGIVFFAKWWYALEASAVHLGVAFLIELVLAQW